MTAGRMAMMLGGLAVIGGAAVPAYQELQAGEGSGVAPVVAEAPSSPAAPVSVAVEPPSGDRAEPRSGDDGGDGGDDREGEPDQEPDEGDGEVWVGPPDVIPDCEAKLEAAGVQFKPSRIPLHKTRSGYYCGAEQIVRYRKGPGSIAWGGSPKVTCGVALAMAQLERVVQEEAERAFGRRVKKIQHMGTYNCREMANYPGWVSEHSYANAIDIKSFTLAGGKEVSVLKHYAKSDQEATTDRARFMRAVARRLYDEEIFSVVLTPSFDRAHRNHFHLDLARYRVDGI